MIFLLNRPQMGENIGACMRVMANFGFREMALIAPRDGWPNEKAITNSAGASELVNVTVFDNLDAALANIKTLYCFTARSRFVEKPAIELNELPKNISNSAGPVGLLFGQENNGLSNSELLQANYLVHIPVDEQFSSLNISQAVGVVSYALSQCKVQPLHEVDQASKSEVSSFLARLISELEEREYFSEQHRDAMESNIRALFGRIDLTSQEIRTLHGVVKCLTRNI